MRSISCELARWCLVSVAPRASRDLEAQPGENMCFSWRSVENEKTRDKIGKTGMRTGGLSVSKSHARGHLSSTAVRPRTPICDSLVLEKKKKNFFIKLLF